MNETFFGYPWDISYDPDTKADTVMIEYEGSDLYLTERDLKEMLHAIAEEEV